MQTLVLGTHNQKKLRELNLLLTHCNLQLVTLKDFDNALEVEETGDTFAANAALKATEQAKHLNHWVLGEDSGLAVDALGGAPGVYSARYSGVDANDEANNDKLLAELGDTPLAKRGAAYFCHVALSNPAGEVVYSTEASCRGRILFERHGSAGFGYDPLFEIPEYHCTFGQLGDMVKTVLSHRSRAMRRVAPRIISLMQD